MPATSKLRRLSRSGSAANSSSSRLIAGCCIAAAHNAALAICHPGLTCWRHGGNKRAMAPTPLPRRTRSAEPGKDREEGGVPARSLRFILLVAIARLGVPQLHRQPVQYSVGIDAADALHRRLSGRREMALRLFALQLPVRLSAVRRPRSRAACPSAATSSSFAIRAENADLIKRVIGLPGDTVEVARAERLILNGHAGAARAACRQRKIADQRQQPVPGGAAGDAESWSRSADRTLCLYRAYLETLARRPELHRARPGRRRTSRRFRPVRRCRPVTSS